MADPEFTEIRNDCRSVAKGEMGIELQAVGRRRNLIEALQCEGNIFRGYTGDKNPSLRYMRQGGSSIQDSVEDFQGKNLMESCGC